MDVGSQTLPKFLPARTWSRSPKILHEHNPLSRSDCQTSHPRRLATSNWHHPCSNGAFAQALDGAGSAVHRAKIKAARPTHALRSQHLPPLAASISLSLFSGLESLSQSGYIRGGRILPNTNVRWTWIHVAPTFSCSHRGLPASTEILPLRWCQSSLL